LNQAPLIICIIAWVKNFANNLTKNTEQLLLLIIIGVATILRFYNYSSLSITGDEISAILRVWSSEMFPQNHYTSFKELIDIGVRPDGHPAGVQVFTTFWTRLFGITEASVRLPFVLAGILSVYFSYLVGRDWFNKNAGLFVAASMCFLQFPLLYSQIARPYSPGLLFTLMATWFWTRLIFYENKHKWLIITLLAISTTGAIYTHYFSFFQVLIVGISGFFFTNKSNLKSYMISIGLVFILFLPHFGVSLGHLQIGGLGEGEWLGSPEQERSWFLDYILFCFNDSWQMIGVFLTILVLTFLKPLYKKSQNKFRILALIWFVFPFLVGYYYSVWVNPVLQRSVLLFSFPFLLLLVFSFVPYPSNIKRLYALLLLFLAVGVFSTVFLNRFYSTHRFGVLKEIVEKVLEYQNKYGDENITKTINIGHPYFVGYYLERYNAEVDYIPFDTENTLHRFRNNGGEELLAFKKIVDNSDTKHFLYQWSSKYSPNEMLPIIQEKYPYMIERELYFNAETYLFSKEASDNTIKEEHLYFSEYAFENNSNDWKGQAEYITSNKAYSGKFSEMLTKENEYSHTFSNRVGDIFTTKENIINVTVMGNFDNIECDANLVISLSSSDGVMYNWNGMNFSYFIKDPNEWKKIYHSVRFHDIRSSDDVISVYVWNSSGKPLYVDDLRISVTEGNPQIYGKLDISL